MKLIQELPQGFKRGEGVDRRWESLLPCEGWPQHVKQVIDLPDDLHKIGWPEERMMESGLFLKQQDVAGAVDSQVQDL